MRRKKQIKVRTYTIAVYRKFDNRDTFLGWRESTTTGRSLFDQRLAWFDETNREYAAYEDDVKGVLV